MPTLYGGVQGEQNDYYPTSNSGGGTTYEDPYSGLFWNPIQPKQSPVTQYSSKYDPFSPNFLGGNQPRWENDPGIFDSGGLLDTLRPWGYTPDSGWYDPQLDDLQRTDPYSTPGNGTNAKAIEEAKKAVKEAAKAGGATNKTPTQSQGGGGGTPEAQYGGEDGSTSRPWWHWALLAGAGGLGVWYLSKKKKKGKK